MYLVFKGIPKAKRQEAFDFLVKYEYGQHGYLYGEDSCYRHAAVVPFYLTEEGNAIGKSEDVDDWAKWQEPCCPLGAINQALGVTDIIVDTLMPVDGETERVLLMEHGNYLVNADDANRFIQDNDHGRFDTLEKLAVAMGATLA